MKLRLCHHKNFPGILHFTEEKGFSGSVGPRLQEAIEILKYYGNATIEFAINQGIGVKNEQTGKFDGCLGRLQNNQSDIVTMLSPYPMNVSNLSQGMIFYDTNLVIGGMYGEANITASGQILDSFKSFTTFVWITCILLCFIISCVAWLRSKIIRRRRVRGENCILYHTVSHCTRQGELSSTGLTSKIIYSTASIYSLLILHYFSSYIKTELVTIEEPQVFYTYRDIIERKAVPIFPRGLAYDDFFKGKEATKERKEVWSYAKKFGEENLYIEMNPVNIFAVALVTLEKRAVMIMESTMMPILPNSGCPFAATDQYMLSRFSRETANPETIQTMSRAFELTSTEEKAVLDFTRRFPSTVDKLPRFLFHTSRDPSEESFIRGMVVNEHLPGQVKRSLFHLARKIFETGFVHRTIRVLSETDIIGSHPAVATLGLDKKFSSKMKHEHECKSETIIKPEVEYHSLTFDNMMSLMIVIFSRYSAISLTLIVELCIHVT